MIFIILFNLNSSKISPIKEMFMRITLQNSIMLLWLRNKMRRTHKLNKWTPPKMAWKMPETTVLLVCLFWNLDLLKNLSFSLIEFKPILQAGSSAGNVMLTVGSSVKWVELSKPACQTKIVSFWNEQNFFHKTI